jgi:hypothetical protein
MNSNNQIMEQDLVNRNIAYGSINNCNGSEIALSSSSIREIPCTLQNCDLNTSCSLIRSSSTLSSGGGIVGMGGCYSAPSTMKINQQNQTSNQSLAQILATNQSTHSLYEQYIDCLNAGAQTILPPPLFDTNCTNINQCYEVQSHPGNYCTLSAIDLPKNSNAAPKRLHRTIPKHFTMSSPSSSSTSTVVIAEVNSQQAHQQSQIPQQPHQQQQQQQSQGILQQSQSQQQQQRENKKSSCQCPVQHVPMYMQYPNSNNQNNQQTSQAEIQPQFAQQQRHQIYMSGKKHNVIKSTTFPSTINTTTVGAKIQTITTSELMGISSNADVIHTQNEMAGSIISSGGSGTLRRKSSSSVNSNNQNMPTTPNKKSIATISVATSVSSGTTSTSTPTYYTPKIDVKHQQQQQSQQQQIHSILKNKNHCSVNVINVVDGQGNEQNPILPPKLYKGTSNSKYCSTPSTPGSSKQIHTITRPNEVTSSNSQFSLLAISNGNGTPKYQQQQQQQNSYQQPTLLRTNIQVENVVKI